MKLCELFGRAGLDYPLDAADIEITDIVTDSRRVRRGSLFLCIEGIHEDGHTYIDNAIRSGASVIVAERVRDACVGGAAAFIMFDNTRKVAALLYNSWYGDPAGKLKIIGVTGTNGKTSVTYMLHQIFTAAGMRAGLIGTVCRLSADGRVISPSKSGGVTSSMTTPDPEELYRTLSIMADDGVEYVFMEVSSHSLALNKVDAISFDMAVFTNLTQDHLDFHRTMEEYYIAKGRLFSMCRRALINADCEYGKRLISDIRCPYNTYSLNEGDFCALDVKSLGLVGSVYKMRSPEGELEISLPIPSSFYVVNSLTAGAVAMLYGIPPKTVKHALEKMRGVPGRMERLELATDEFSVIIDYAHTPDALEVLLSSVHSFKAPHGHIILVFGCGGERDRTKRKTMGQIASKIADLVIVTSDNSRGEDTKQIISDILKGIDKEKPYTVIEDRRAAIESAVLSASVGDIIVLAGKGHEKYEINAEGKHPFDEIKIVKTALKKRCD